MKIITVSAHQVESTLPEPFAFSQGWVHTRSATLVKITTDTGLTGWGEAFSQGLEPPQISAAVIEHALKPLIMGSNPLETEVLWHRMYHQTRDYGRKGSVMAGISAVDIALWDIIGQHYQQPIARMLGGSFRDQVQPYATGFYRLKGQGEAARLADEALSHYENDFRLMKIKLGFGIEDDIDVMHAIAKVLQGKDVGLMIDTNHAYGRQEAQTLGDALSELQLLWYEEPVVPEDLESYAYLRDQLSMPIAGGENEHSLYGFRECFKQDVFDIVQPDLCSCGGFTAARHITAMAQAFGVRVNPHVWGSAVAQAASLQWIAALPVTHHNLFPQQPLLEFDTSAHPFRNELVDQPVTRTDGSVAISTQPGLGIAINSDVIEHYHVN